MQKISACLWFNGDALEAAKFYTSIFKKSKITQIIYYGEAGSKASGKAKGPVLTVAFELQGQKFLGLNGGPEYNFTPAVSFMVNCKTQKEIDYYWEKLSKGGEKIKCGWLRDKFGLSWQVVPEIWSKMLSDLDSKKAERVMKVLIKMKKLNIKDLKKAFID